MNNLTISKYTILVLGLIAFCVLVFSFVQSQQVKAAAPGGLSATIATSTVIAMPQGTAVLLFATSTSNCISRLVGTAGSGMTMTFSDFKGQRPTGNSGYWQASSTTVAYDSALYGCAAVYASSTSAQNVIVSETR